MTVRRAHPVISGSDIFIVLSHIGNTRQYTVKRCVEDGALVLGSSLHFDFAQCFIPGLTRLSLRPIEVPCRNLALQVLACLIQADTGDADAYFNLSRLVQRRLHHDSEAATTPFARPCEGWAGVQVLKAETGLEDESGAEDEGDSELSGGPIVFEDGLYRLDIASLRQASAVLDPDLSDLVDSVLATRESEEGGRAWDGN